MFRSDCLPDQRRPFSPRTLLDYLRDPDFSAPKPTAELPTAPNLTTGNRDAEWLPLAQDHRTHIRPWTDFSYPVLRIVFKDVLMQPLDKRPLPLNRAAEWILGLGEFERNSPLWIRSIQDASGKGSVDVWSLLEVGKRLNMSVMQGLQRLDIDEEPSLRARIKGGKMTEEEMGKFGCPRDADWSLRIRPTGQERESRGQAQEKWVVLGMNKAAEDFPISLLGHFNDRGKIDERIEKTLRLLGTMCWEKETPYAFVLTAEGAAVLLFKEIHADVESESGASSPAGGQQPELGVWWARVPWTRPRDDLLGLPLLMALWSLCLIAVCDDDRSFDGATARLNGWHQRKEMRRIWYDHRLVPQPSRGVPPGAEILSRSRLLSTSVTPSMNQSSPVSFFDMYRGWMPDGLDISMEDLSSPTITRFMQRSPKRVPGVLPHKQEEVGEAPNQVVMGTLVMPVSSQDNVACMEFKTPALIPDTAADHESAETTDFSFQPARSNQADDLETKGVIQSAKTLVTSPAPSQTCARVKRKRTQASREQPVEPPEPWSERLRTRKRRLVYRV